MSHRTAAETGRRVVRGIGAMMLALVVVAVLTSVFFDAPGEHSTGTRAGAAVGAIVVGFNLLLPYLLTASVLHSFLVRPSSTAPRSIGGGLLLGAVAGLAAGGVAGYNPATLLVRLALISSAVGGLYGALTYLVERPKTLEPPRARGQS